MRSSAALLAVFFLSMNADGQSATAESAVRAVVQSVEDSLNDRDWEAFGALFAKEGDFILMDSRRAVGPAEARSLIATSWAEVPADVTATLTPVALRFVTPQVAILTVDGEFSGSQPSTDRAIFVVSNKGPEWRLEALRVFAPEARRQDGDRQGRTLRNSDGGLSPVGIPTAAAAAEELEVLDRHIVEAMDDWQIPGLALVVVTDGESRVIKGYGTRQYGTTPEIDSRTYLQIASNTKAFTAYAIGMLVDDGKLDWDDPVKMHIPEFSVPDPHAEAQISIDDLLSHRSGLTEVALGGFLNDDYTIDDLLEELGQTPLSTRFRAQNNYSQVGMALLGEIVTRVSGVTWEQFVRTRIFEPLGMTASYTSTLDFSTRVGPPVAVENIMVPAVMKDGQIRNESWDTIGTMPLYAPTGGIITNPADISGWIQFRLNDGVKGSKRLISRDSIQAIRAPRIPADFENMGMPYAYFHPEAELIDVGFGQYSFEHRGHRVLIHNGGWMSSVVAIMPGADIGVGVFSSAWFDEPAWWTSLAFVNGIALDVFDHFLDQPHADWVGRMASIVADQSIASKDENGQEASPSDHAQ